MELDNRVAREEAGALRRIGDHSNNCFPRKRADFDCRVEQEAAHVQRFFGGRISFLFSLNVILLNSELNTSSLRCAFRFHPEASPVCSQTKLRRSPRILILFRNKKGP